MADPTCKVIEVDGEPALIRGSGRMSKKDQAAIADVVRAARKAMEDERAKDPEAYDAKTERMLRKREEMHDLARQLLAEEECR